MRAKTKISIVTPCLNAAGTIQRAIESVVAQGYSEWEHIVIDGGSSDGTLAVLRQYQHLKVVSEPDQGQADAMNKGAELATGDVLGFLNADDYYLPGAFNAISDAFEDGADFVMGNVLVKSLRYHQEYLNIPRTDLMSMLRHWEKDAFCYNPVGYFLRPWVHRHCGFNRHNHESMDLEFLLAARAICCFKKIESTLGCYEDGFGTVTDRTQLMPDYWRSSRFPYIEYYLDHLSELERRQFRCARREGYARRQLETNTRARERYGSTTCKGLDSTVAVTIFVVARGSAEDLKAAIRSAASQSHENTQIVVLLDKPRSDVAQIVSDKVSSFVDTNLAGKSSTELLKVAGTIASGRYVYMLSSGVELFPSSIEHLASIAFACRADIVQGGTVARLFDRDWKIGGSDFSSDGGLDGLQCVVSGRYKVAPFHKLYSARLLQSLKHCGEHTASSPNFALACWAAFHANRIVSVSDPLRRMRWGKMPGGG